MLSLIERAQDTVDQKKAEELARKLRRNEFTLEDFRDQLKSVKRMGPLSGVMSMMPGMGQVREADLDSGAGIEIELRPGYELTTWRSEATAPAGVDTWNPAFDVTPAELITAIITDVGVLRPPFEDSIRTALREGDNP
jgi:hypothetical protein